MSAGNALPAGYRAKPVCREDIARAMELREAGSTEAAIYKLTGVTPMDLTVAEIMGTSAYPSRTDSSTQQENPSP